MVIEICLAAGVQELLGIKEIIESANTINLRLIRGTDRPLARQARKGADMLTEMYRQTEPAKVGGQTETAQTLDIVGKSSAPPPVQSVPPHSRGMSSKFVMIS